MYWLEGGEERAKYSSKDRKAMAKKGHALPDGSYPIADAEDLGNAIHAVGRGGADHDAIRRHIIKRAKALNLSSQIPDNWNSDGSLKTQANAMLTLEQRKQKADSLRGREVRRCPVAGLELRETPAGLLNMSGWASVTERSYDMGFYQETIKRGAFARSLGDNPDVQLLVNHEGLPLARTVGGTLRLSEDDRGLHVDADLDPSDPDVQRLAPKVQRGLIDEMSFAFNGAKSEWDEDYTQRSIVDLSIHRGDVSIVNHGANPETSFQFNDARALEWLRSLPADEAKALFAVAFPPDPEPAPPARVHDLDLYRARAHALSLRAR